jgi:hypothetical protein
MLRKRAPLNPVVLLKKFSVGALCRGILWCIFDRRRDGDARLHGAT